jgi:Glycoside Hydrolase Family 113
MGRPVTSETPIAGGGAAGIAPARQRVQSWLACLASYYPLFWLANSLVWSGSAVANAILSGGQVEGFSLTPFGAFAAVAPQVTGSNSSHEWLSPSGSSRVVVILIVIAAAALVAWFGKRARVLSGFAVAVLADSALAYGARRLIESHRVSFGVAVSSLIFFSVMCFGLRWMLSGIARIGEGSRSSVSGVRAAGFLARFGNLLAGFVLFPLLPWVWSVLTRGYELWPFALMLMAPTALAAIVASLRAIRPAAQSQWAGWQVPVLGVAAAAILIVGVNLGQAEITREREAATRTAMAAYPAIPADAPYEKILFQKGISISAEGWGGYESESGRQMLEALRRDGVNAIALVPYGFEPSGRAEVRLNTGTGSWESDEGLEMMARVAHALGMKVMLKPGVWVGNGGYAGSIEWDSPAERARWFDSYTHFVEHYATLAKEIHADLFCVGGEFVKLTRYETDWRKVIARARELYPGPMVYAANFGDEFETIKFWDALDYIGLQDYYPLPDDLATDDVVRKVEAVQKRFQRPVIFTEVGFASGENSNRTPWEDGHGKPALELQARCYRVVLEAFYDKPWFEGMYWWKVGTNGLGGRDDTSLTPWGKPAMDVVKRWYSKPRK